MNDAATAGGATGASLIPSTTDAFTIAHLVVLAIFAIAVIAVIVWGSRLKARRRAAERDIAQRNVEVEHSGAAVDDAPAHEALIEEAPPLVEEAPVAPPAIRDEPVPAPAPVVTAPAVTAASAPAAGDAPVGTLKGLGPKLVTRLGELGITNVGQIAALTDDEAAQLDAQLGPFAGRITRDRWIEQARFLAAGDLAGFEAVFGRL